MLSLQDKLDQIAREREVLALRQALARAGLREGDTVRNVRSGAVGRLELRSAKGAAPAAVVRMESGEEEAYSAEAWQHA